MQRTLLYYPTFELPSEQWLKDGVLYWDEVGSIVPKRFGRIIQTPSLKLLRDEGFYRPFDPGACLEDYDVADNFTRYYVERLDSPEFAIEMAQPDSGQYWSIAFEKMTYSAWVALVERQLAADTPDTHQFDGWIRVKKPAALLYMGLLARFLAAHDGSLVQPSTNRPEYEDIIYRCTSVGQPLHGAALTLRDLLPQVSSETTLEELVQFKRKRRDELLRLRQVIDSLQSKLAICEDADEAKLCLIQFKEQFELSLMTIERTLGESGIRHTVGVMRAIFSLKSPVWLSGLAGYLTGSHLSDPIYTSIGTIAGFIGGGAIEVANYMIDASDKRRSALESPFSYLYSAKQSGIISKARVTMPGAA